MEPIENLRIISYKTSTIPTYKGATVLEDVQFVGTITDEKGRTMQAHAAAGMLVVRQTQVECTMCKDGLDEYENARSPFTHLCKYCGGSKIRNL